MPVVFYYHNNPTLRTFFGAYTQVDWNQGAAVTDAPGDGPNHAALTEAGILDTLTSRASQYATTKGVQDGEKFYKLVYDIAAGTNTDLTIYILKGIHTKPENHLSVGFAGKIYHLNVKRRGDGDRSKFSIHSMSEGGQTWDDPEWKVKKVRY